MKRSQNSTLIAVFTKTQVKRSQNSTWIAVFTKTQVKRSQNSTWIAVFTKTQVKRSQNSTWIAAVMITYNIYIVIRETGQFSSKGIINDFIGNLNRLTVSRRFTEQAV